MRDRLRAVFAPDGHALDLAVFRITIALVVLTSTSAMVAPDWASMPPETRVAPLGVGWLVPHLVITEPLVRFVRGLMYAACITGALGLASRLSFAVITACAFYVLLIPQLGGAVFHDHHLLWLSVLLSASPCGDALSFDAWWARRRGTPRATHGPAYGMAIRVAWLVIGLVFLFPGFQKLHHAGLDWVTGDTLRHQLWWKWALDPSLMPRVRIDRMPWLLHVLAGLVVLFELSFVVLVFVKRTRPVAVVSALVFHAGTHLLMGIDFSVLYACYTVFVPWASWFGREGARTTEGTAPVTVAGLALIVGVGTAGAMGAMQAYPFACYPTFAHDPGAEMHALVVEVTDADGHTARLDRALYFAPGPRGVALEWRLVGAYGDASPSRLRAWWRDAASREPLRTRLRDVESVRFFYARRSVDPDRPGMRVVRAL